MSETWLEFLEGKIDAKAVLEKYKEQGSTGFDWRTSLPLARSPGKPDEGTRIRCKSRYSGQYALGGALYSKSKGPEGTI